MKAGQTIICVDARPNPETSKYTPVMPVMGGIYTVREIVIQPHIEGFGVILEEVLNPSIVWNDGDDMEWPFKSERFRPFTQAGLEEYMQAMKAIKEPA